MTELSRTPLYDLHRELEARMVPFAGYEMPVQYPSGIKTEHLHTRNRAGLFDVSHMGQIRITGGEAAARLERLMPMDMMGLKAGQQRYALLTNDDGGILDDLMVTHLGDELYLVVNAACKKRDLALLRRQLGDDVEELTDRALLALQGPKAAAVLERLCPEATQGVFMTTVRVQIMGYDCLVSRSGYTGEDGFEISLPNQGADALARALLEQEAVAMIGLGARDSLRLEAGLCLYGHDIDETTTPVEAALTWAIQKVRRRGGEREGGFPGDRLILEQLEQGPPRRRVGILPAGRAPVREGSALTDPDGCVVGKVTSGGFGPTLDRPIAMGYVPTPLSGLGTELNALVRGRPLPVRVAKAGFVPQRYHRG
ncbi:MAG: glycine cleavage system aminomethyltransferase GcvT [Candidatus Competibacteraceae bacterium]|nr:glycine cleavage system aminomethyltransferase GcvT [Candidatus Competibacteraceae bacterium]